MYSLIFHAATEILSPVQEIIEIEKAFNNSLLGILLIPINVLKLKSEKSSSSILLIHKRLL